jgi:hypothetical protein
VEFGFMFRVLSGTMLESCLGHVWDEAYEAVATGGLLLDHATTP